MNKHIGSLAQLKQEIERVKDTQRLKEREITNQVKDFTRSLTPASLIKNALGSVGNDAELRGMVRARGIETGIAFIVSQMLFKHSNPLVRAAVTVVGTSLATNLFGADSSKYVEKAKNLFNKFRKKHKDKHTGLFNEEDIYGA